MSAEADRTHSRSLRLALVVSLLQSRPHLEADALIREAEVLGRYVFSGAGGSSKPQSPAEGGLSHAREED